MNHYNQISNLPRVRSVCGLILACALFTSCSVMLPVSATEHGTEGSKTGTATAVNVLGFWVNNDASIKSAAENGHITHITRVEKKDTNILYIFHSVETIVNGD